MASKLALLLAPLFLAGSSPGEEQIEIGNRLQLFLDDHLFESVEGDAHLHLMTPEPREVVLVADKHWEGNTSAYYTLFKDGDRFRMVYRGWQHDTAKKEAHPAVACYAESADGIRGTRPNLGLFEWDGSKENNIIWPDAPASHNFTPFRDENPGASPESKFKALGGHQRGSLFGFRSPDGTSWKQIRPEPLITDGYFDSQNLAFWDADRKEYRAYYRTFIKGVRAIRTATSKDFLTWENHSDLTYQKDAPNEHLYTNAIQKYHRAPHLFIGFPTRYLPKDGQRVEPVFMSGRDGVSFHRWPDPVISEDAPEDRKGNRSNYMAYGILELPGKPGELSVYATEAYYGPTPGRLRRFTYRTDGFVALRGSTKGGSVITKTLRYSGTELLLNYVVRKGGSLLIETLDAAGLVSGISKPITGDAIDAAVDWERRPPLKSGFIRLRMTLADADVFSFRFGGDR